MNSKSKGRKKGKHNVLSWEKEFINRCEKQKRTEQKDKEKQTLTHIKNAQLPNYLYEEGPLTRRKEGLLIKINEDHTTELNSLMKFDEYYKNPKNVEHEAYHYKKPRIDKVLYQCDLDDLKKQNEGENLLPKEMFTVDKLNDNDKNYYFKLVQYIKKDYPAHPVLKGFHHSEAQAIQLLKENNYDIDLCLKKILFPSTFIVKSSHRGSSFNRFSSGMIGYSTGMSGSKRDARELKEAKEGVNARSPVSEKHKSSDKNDKTETQITINPINTTSTVATDISKYLNSALHDLIGSNFTEKEAWLSVVSSKINSGIDYSELTKLLEVGDKMKIDIPESILTEIKLSLDKSKSIKRLLIEKTNSIEGLEKAFEDTKQSKVRTEEFYLLKDYINKCQSWQAKALSIISTTASYKTLQNMYNEGKNLPVKFSELELIKVKYSKAQSWLEKYNLIPKHSKTRQGISQIKSQERTSLNEMKTLIAEAEEIGFASSEIFLLKSGLSALEGLEMKITCRLENEEQGKISKEELIEFLSQLDNLKFNTSLYDDLISELEFIEWKEKRDSLLSGDCYSANGTTVKLKQLKSLVSDRKKGNKLHSKAMNEFKKEVEKIEEWINFVSCFFYDKDNSNLDYSLEELKNFVEEAREFKYKVEEVDFLLQSAEEVFIFTEECIKVLNNKDYDQEKLFKLRDKIVKYKVKCPEFEMITDQINEINNWLCEYKRLMKLKQAKEAFIEKTKDLIPSKAPLTVKQRFTIVEILDEMKTFGGYSMNALVKLDQLSKSLNQKYESEFALLKKVIKQAENQMEIFSMEYLQSIDINKLLSNFEHIILPPWSNNYFNCFSIVLKIKSYFSQDFLYQKDLSFLFEVDKKADPLEILSLLSITPTDFNYKLSLCQAELLIKEASTCKINIIETEQLKILVFLTKEWIKLSKKISSSNVATEKVSYSFFKNLIKEGCSLPFQTEELKDLLKFQDSLNDLIVKSRGIYKIKENDCDKVKLNYLHELYTQISDITIDIKEFELVFLLRNFVIEVRQACLKVIGLKRKTKLYFAPKIIENYKDKDKDKAKERDDRNKDKADNRKVSSSLKKRVEESDGSEKFLGKKRKKNTSIEEQTFETIQTHQTNQTISSNLSYPLNLSNITYSSNILNQSPHSNTNLNLSSDRKANKSNLSQTNGNLQASYTNSNNHVNINPKILSHAKLLKPCFKTKQPLKAVKSIKPSLPYFNSTFDSIKPKLFLSLNYTEQLAMLSQFMKLKEKGSVNEEFCICRQGDDSVNEMIQCEVCCEWFHTACLRLRKEEVALNKSFKCVFCLRRKDLKASKDETSLSKKVSLDFIDNLITTGLNLPVKLDEIDMLIDIRNEYLDWERKYSELLVEITLLLKKFNGKVPRLNDDIEAKIRAVYLQNESLIIENLFFTVLLLIVKQFDWFAELVKCFEGKKFSEKTWKRLCINYDRLFNFYFEQCDVTDLEKNCLQLIVEYGRNLFKEYENKLYYKEGGDNLISLNNFNVVGAGSAIRIGMGNSSIEAIGSNGNSCHKTQSNRTINNNIATQDNNFSHQASLNTLSNLNINLKNLTLTPQTSNSFNPTTPTQATPISTPTSTNMVVNINLLNNYNFEKSEIEAIASYLKTNRYYSSNVANVEQAFFDYANIKNQLINLSDQNITKKTKANSKELLMKSIFIKRTGKMILNEENILQEEYTLVEDESGEDEKRGSEAMIKLIDNLGYKTPFLEEKKMSLMKK